MIADIIHPQVQVNVPLAPADSIHQPVQALVLHVLQDTPVRLALKVLNAVRDIIHLIMIEAVMHVTQAHIQVQVQEYAQHALQENIKIQPVNLPVRIVPEVNGVQREEPPIVPIIVPQDIIV